MAAGAASLAQHVLARLRETDPAALGEARSRQWRRLGDPPSNGVHGALDVATAGDGLRAPCVAVLLLGEAATPNSAPGAGAAVQRLTATVGVLVCTVRRNDPGGRKGFARGAGYDDMNDLISAVRSRLLGWPPRQRWDPLELRQGRLQSLADGRAWWQDEYATTGWADYRPAR